MRVAIVGVLTVLLAACTATPAAEQLPTRVAQPSPSAPPQTPAPVAQSSTPVATDVPLSRVQVVESQPTTSPVPFVGLARPSASPSPIALPLSVLVGHSGSDLRTSLDLALEENLYLAGASIAAVADGRLDEEAAIADPLDQTSSTIAAIVGAVRGAPVQAALLDGLRRQTADPTNSPIPTGDAIADTLLRGRAESLRTLSATDAIRSSATVRSVAAHTDDVVRPLVAQLATEVPGQIAGSTDDADTALRLAVDRRLQERDYLLGRALHAEDSDTSADLAAANATVDEIAALLAPSYGQDVAARITAPLHARNAALVHPDHDRSTIAAQLDQARTDLDTALSAANPLVPRGIAAAELRAEDQELQAAVEALATSDWRAVYSHLHQAARLSQRFGDTLAQATSDRYPNRFLATPTPEASDSPDAP